MRYGIAWEVLECEEAGVVAVVDAAAEEAEEAALEEDEWEEAEWEEAEWAGEEEEALAGAAVAIAEDEWAWAA